MNVEDILVCLCLLCVVHWVVVDYLNGNFEKKARVRQVMFRHSRDNGPMRRV